MEQLKSTAVQLGKVKEKKKKGQVLNIIFWSYNLIKLLNFMKGVLDEVLQSLSLRNSKLDHLNGYFWLL